MSLQNEFHHQQTALLPNLVGQLTDGLDHGPPIWAKPVQHLFSAFEHGQVHVIWPNGYKATYGSSDATHSGASINIHSARAISRIITGGDIGFAEGFMAGDWSTPNLTQTLEVLAANMDGIEEKIGGKWYVRLVRAFEHRFLNRNTKNGSRRNILAHYDLGNDFYSQWLDKTMTYSAAYFDADNADLAAAQTNKYRKIADQLELKPGMRVLEIGCGWGGFAEYAAKERGCFVTGVTISDAQLAFAQARMTAQSLDDLVRLKLCDYRDIDGEFDAIASIEMFEAVGEEYWPQYFATLRDRLKKGGKACLQVITIDERLLGNYRRRPDFIQRHIFPGGMLPSQEALAHQTHKVGLTYVRADMFGLDYAKTLSIWAVEFKEKWARIAKYGFDETFYRMWLYYLSYCEAGFLTGRTNVGHFLLQKPA